jgi:3'-phosphoadenosine 5'-phosphosulfate (PAPS) 3'-phosphatase
LSPLLSISDLADLRELLIASVVAAKHASRYITEIHASGNLESTLKTENDKLDFQTAADIAAESAIMTILTSLYPNLRIIGEESEHDVSLVNSDGEFDRDAIQVERDSVKHLLPASQNPILMDAKAITVYVDPLDGTADFVKGNLEAVTTLIGIAIDAKPVAGVIYRPFYDECLFGFDHFVYRINLKTMQLDLLPKITRDQITDNTCVRVVASKSRSDIKTEEILKKVPHTLVKVGGAGWKFWLLITGQADLYVHPSTGMKLWDVCAGNALLEIVGGSVTDYVNGEGYKYDETQLVVKGVFATNMKGVESHKELLNRLKST